MEMCRILSVQKLFDVKSKFEAQNGATSIRKRSLNFGSFEFLQLTYLLPYCMENVRDGSSTLAYCFATLLKTSRGSYQTMILDWFILLE